MLGTSIGLLGFSLPQFLHLRSQALAREQGSRPKSCIVLFCWGGISHLESWDPKPDGPSHTRGEFKTTATATPGIHICEHLPRLAQQTERLAIIRSMHHLSSGHRKALYWNMTGHPAPAPRVEGRIPPSREHWPSLASMIAKVHTSPDELSPRELPSAIRLPYPMYDGSPRGGEYGGWLGVAYDPVTFFTPKGKHFSDRRAKSYVKFSPAQIIDRERIKARDELNHVLGDRLERSPEVQQFQFFRQQAKDVLLSSKVQETFDLDREPQRVRDAYGDHICGQSMLLSRRLIEAGVPVVTVACSASELGGGTGDHWDTHFDHFSRLKKTMLPVLDRSAAALLDDLADRGRLDDTLVVFLTEFGRTPQINGRAGRDHFPNVYSVALAGAGIRGGQVYGSSNAMGSEPRTDPCIPNDLHATIFKALDIPLDTQIHDRLGQPHFLTDGKTLPLF